MPILPVGSQPLPAAYCAQGRGQILLANIRVRGSERQQDSIVGTRLHFEHGGRGAGISPLFGVSANLVYRK
jgi:hypothetical protein